MAQNKLRKKVQNAVSSTALTPAQYMRTKVQDLPLGPCYALNPDFESTGVDSVIVTRMHKQGTITAGMFLIDMLGFGIKDAFFQFNLQVEQFRERFLDDYNPIEIGYHEAEERVINGYACARLMKNSMPKHFVDAQYILEPEWKRRYEQKEYTDRLPQLAKIVMDANPELAQQAIEVAQQELARRQAEEEAEAS